MTNDTYKNAAVNRVREARKCAIALKQIATIIEADFLVAVNRPALRYVTRAVEALDIAQDMLDLAACEIAGKPTTEGENEQ